MKMSSDHPLVAPLHRLASSIRSAAITGASDVFGSKWCESIGISPGFFDGEIPQGREICRMPMRREKPGELVRVDLNLQSGAELTGVVREFLRMELEPFIIGVGKVRADDAPEGLVIVTAEDGGT
jgi:hypothetical protein